MHSSSGINAPRRSSFSQVGCEPGRLSRLARGGLGALLCALAIFAAGCHRTNIYSDYGDAWVTLTDTPGDFTSYIVNVDSITLTRSDGVVVTALATVETVDLAKLNNIAELWGTATIPIGTYKSASIVLDYTNAFISVMVGGLPQKATVVDSAGAAVTTQTINVNLDVTDAAADQLTIAPTYATTAAQRLAIDFNLAASTASINLASSPPTVVVRPYLTAAIAPADNKPIRIRGPLINSNVDVGTYTVYVRPFYDEVDNLGTLSIFTNADTIFTTNGTATQGAAGLAQLSQSSAGSTVTAAYTTYQPTATPTATAGIFHALYVVAGSTLEDVYTQGIEGDVVARSGNTLTLQGSTLFLNDGISSYNVANAQVLLGPSTLVTADDTTLTGLNYSSVAVGQHIIARGIYSLSGTTVILDSTGASSTNTGSVRLISTNLWGSLVSSGAGNLLLNLQTINNWPVSDYTFAGNGTSAATDPVAAGFAVNTGALTVPATPAGDPLWIDGLFAPFGSAPPDFTASTVNDELSVQTAGATATSPTPLSCGQGNFECIPASLRVYWTSPGTSAPFSALNASGMTVDLSNASFSSGVIRIGPESIDITTLPASPQIVPTATPTPVTTQVTSVAGSIPVTLPPVFLPEYSYGNPAAVAPAGINVFNVFSTFASGLPAALATTPALQFEARGTYNRATNTFNAISVDVVL
ncbi:MAG: hypothetical protein ACLQO1_03305 [Steroidobacteraceae bacterium]